jgi:hypothetical protein
MFGHNVHASHAAEWHSRIEGGSKSVAAIAVGTHLPSAHAIHGHGWLSCQRYIQLMHSQMAPPAWRSISLGCIHDT